MSPLRTVKLAAVLLLCLCQRRCCFDRSMARAFQWRLSSTSSSDGAIASSVAHNWKYGLQAHRICFEGIHPIKHIRLHNNSVLLGDVSGRVCVIDADAKDVVMASHKVHEKEIVALDFDGELIACASSDGLLTVASLQNPLASDNADLTAGVRKHRHHERPVTGVRIFKGRRKGEEPLVISCGLDRRLVGVEARTCELKYNTLLEANPLCTDIRDDYVVVGLLSGWVLFFNARTGKQILRFEAHSGSGVRSVFFQSQDILLTGGNDGVIRRWDLSREEEEEEEKREVSSNDDGLSFPANADRPTRLIDFYFSDAINLKRPETKTGSDTKIKSRDNSAFKEFKHSTVSEPVVSLQADSGKIVAAYAEGTVTVFDAKKGDFLFDIKGRSNLLSSVQFDETRLIADGTNELLIVHDFANAANSTDEIVLSDSSYEN